jgi:hypothetical protein
MSEDRHVTFELGTPDILEQFRVASKAYAEEALIKTEEEVQRGTSTYVFSPFRSKLSVFI